MTPVTITLPWPDKQLSPNARVDRRARARLVAETRSRAGLETLRQWPARGLPVGNTIPLRLRFFPPDLRHRDLDNCLASNKAQIDGLADALQVNDTEFRPITIDWGDVVPGGQVVVEIGQ